MRQQSMRGGWLVAIAVVALVAAAAFWPWIVQGKVLAPLDIVEEMFLPWRGEKVHPAVHNHFVTDVVLQHIPYRMVMHESLRQDGYIGWNPFVFGGTPQHANTIMITNEVTMSLHRFCDFWVAWNLGRLLQILIAGLGMLVFLRSIGSLPGVALLGAVGYMLNHQFVAWIYFHQLVAAFCWIPWALWALGKAREGNRKYLAPAAVFVALALLGATLQQAAFIVAVMGCLWLGWLIDGRAQRGNILRSTLVVAIAALLGAGLAAFALEPSIALYLDNNLSGHQRGALAYDAGWSQPLWHLLASPLTAYPFLLGSVQSLDLWKLFKSDIGNAGFFGTLPMLLACAGLFSRRVPSSAKLMMIAGVIVPLTPLVGLLYVRFNILWILGGCWAAAAWLNQADDAELARLGRVLRILVGILAALWLAGSVVLWSVRSMIEPFLEAKVVSMAKGSAYGFFTAWMVERSGRLLDFFCIWHPLQVVALAGLAISIVGLPWIKMPKFYCYAAAIGVVLQLSVFWWQMTTWSEPKLPYGNSSLEKVLQKRGASLGRLAVKPRSWAEYMAPPNTLMPAGIPITAGYDSIHPFGMRSPSGVEWEFPGTTHFLGRSDEPAPADWPVVWSEGEWRLWENPSPSMGVVSVRANAEQVVLVPQKVERPTHNTMRVAVPEGATGLSVFSNWHRGWEWRMGPDDEWQKVGLGDNRTMRIEFAEAMPVTREVFFRYSAAPPFWVMCLSLLSLVVVALIGAAGRIKAGCGRAGRMEQGEAARPQQSGESIS